MQRIIEYLKERNIPKDSLEANSILEGYELGIERTKKYIIAKAVLWIKSQMYVENIFAYDEDNQPVRYVCASCCNSVNEFIEEFKKAIENGN